MTSQINLPEWSNHFLVPSADGASDSATRSTPRTGVDSPHARRYGSQMKLVPLSIILLLVCGCSSEKERFYRDMRDRYEVQCDKFYAIYDAGDVGSATKALRDVIDVSLAEKAKAKYYWRFDIMIAFAKARLAVIAEMQGDKVNATDLFASASAYEMSGEIALDQDVRTGGSGRSVGAKAWTSAQWRKAIAALDKNMHVRWKSPNDSPEPSAVNAAGSATLSTPEVGVGSPQ
jgi:hypothetical protein